MIFLSGPGGTKKRRSPFTFIPRQFLEERNYSKVTSCLLKVSEFIKYMFLISTIYKQSKALPNIAGLLSISTCQTYSQIIDGSGHWRKPGIICKHIDWSLVSLIFKIQLFDLVATKTTILHWVNKTPISSISKYFWSSHLCLLLRYLLLPINLNLVEKYYLVVKIWLLVIQA